MFYKLFRKKKIESETCDSPKEQAESKTCNSLEEKPENEMCDSLFALLVAYNGMLRNRMWALGGDEKIKSMRWHRAWQQILSQNTGFSACEVGEELIWLEKKVCFQCDAGRLILGIDTYELGGQNPISAEDDDWMFVLFADSEEPKKLYSQMVFAMEKALNVKLLWDSDETGYPKELMLMDLPLPQRHTFFVDDPSQRCRSIHTQDGETLTESIGEKIMYILAYDLTYEPMLLLRDCLLETFGMKLEQEFGLTDMIQTYSYGDISFQLFYFSEDDSILLQSTTQNAMEQEWLRNMALYLKHKIKAEYSGR